MSKFLVNFFFLLLKLGDVDWIADNEMRKASVAFAEKARLVRYVPPASKIPLPKRTVVEKTTK